MNEGRTSVDTATRDAADDALLGTIRAAERPPLPGSAAVYCAAAYLVFPAGWGTGFALWHVLFDYGYIAWWLMFGGAVLGGLGTCWCTIQAFRRSPSLLIAFFVVLPVLVAVPAIIGYSVAWYDVTLVMLSV